MAPKAKTKTETVGGTEVTLEPVTDSASEEETKTSEELIADAESEGNRDVDQRTKDEKARDSQAAKKDAPYEGDTENQAPYMEDYS